MTQQHVVEGDIAPTRQEARDSRTAILDAAAHLMRSRGYERTAISHICEESGLPVGSIYHHFANKSAILAAVIERWAIEFFEGLPTYRRGTGDPDAQLAEYWRVATEAAVAHRDWFILDTDMQRLSRHDHDLDLVRKRVRVISRGAMAASFEAFAREKGADEPRLLAQRLAAIMERATRGMVLGAGDDVAELRQAFVDLHLVVWSTITLAAR